MILITDSNILVSALIKPKGTTASILKQKSNLQFTAPDYIFEELREHWDKVVASSDLTEKQLKEELKYYKERIKLSYVSEIPTSILLKAHALVDDIDEDDTFLSPFTYIQDTKYGLVMKN
nr:PIN domain-containing protein [uncultured Capnocytophaga sp.]